MIPSSVSVFLLLLSTTVSGFAPTQLGSPISGRATSESKSFRPGTQLPAVVPNPFQQLPWNAERTKQREAQKLKLERSQLHRKLGIAEDATYEEIVEATDKLIARAGDDLKQKMQIEVAKDKIWQIQLNERFAGTAAATSEARARSTEEKEEGSDKKEDSKKEATQWKAPLWTQGLIVKPDEDRIRSQLRVWGGVTLAGVAWPDLINLFNRFTWLVIIGQLCFRGVPKESLENGGRMGLSFSSDGKNAHMKVAFLLGFAITGAGYFLVHSLMPSWAKVSKHKTVLAFVMRNGIYALSSMYLQPYKG